MLIKSADDQSDLLRTLQRTIDSGTAEESRRAKRDLATRNAGLRGERESSYQIEFHFGDSSNWAIVHDLRVRHGDRSAQIDHLLINRWMDVYVIESKHFHAGLKITENGEFLSWNDYRKTFEGMASPLEQNDRHIIVLRSVFSALTLPTRLGIRLEPTFHSLVLVSPKSRIDRPKAFDSSKVIKADQLKQRIHRDIEQSNASLLGLLGGAAKIISSATLEDLTRRLCQEHQPVQRLSEERATYESGPEPTSDPKATTPAPCKDLRRPVRTSAAERALCAAASSPGFALEPALCCKACGSNGGTILYGKYGYYFKCSACETNTNIKFTCKPGHHPKLRKAALEFFRDCGECGTSTLFHRNR